MQKNLSHEYTAILNHKPVKFITSRLDDLDESDPYKLVVNEKQCFMGSVILGEGFIITEEQAKDMIARDPIYKKVLFPYLVGEDLNNEIDGSPSRWVINFFDFPLERSIDVGPNGHLCASDFPEALDIVRRLVYPTRLKSNRVSYRDNWWRFAERSVALQKKIGEISHVITVALTSKTLAFTFTPSNIVHSHMTGVIPSDNFGLLAILQSSFHSQWSWLYGSTMKTDLSYGPSSLYQTFPFPISQSVNGLEEIGKRYYEERRSLMLEINLGLTKTYNLFHIKELTPAVIAKSVKLLKLDMPRAAYLYQRLSHLRELHKQMDEAVAAAYGWNDLNLEHGFHEMDYLPENDRVRYTISPAARREVLRRLLQLNHEIHAREVAEQEALAAVNKKPKGRKTKPSAPKLEL